MPGSMHAEELLNPLGAREELSGRAFVNDPAAVEDDDVLCHALGDADSAPQAGSWSAPQLLERYGDVCHERGSETLRRLIDQEQRVVVQERPRDRDHLLLAARERARTLAPTSLSSGKSS